MQSSPQEVEEMSSFPPLEEAIQPKTGLDVLLGRARREKEGEVCCAAAILGVLYAGVGEGSEPSSYKEAMEGLEAAEWKAGVERELQSIKEHGVWEERLVELPKGKEAVSVKFVFRKKTNDDGKVVEYKARLVARGFSQVPGEDFDETYAWVAKLTTGRMLLAQAALNGWHVEQMDVKSAFLNGVLKEEIYIQQPEGLEDGTSRVYRLKKALYGLKQAPRVWNNEIGGFLIQCGFTKSSCDDALFVLHHHGTPLFVLVYVDDLLLVSPRMALISKLKRQLGEKYMMKDLGEVSTYLGIQVTRSATEGWLEIGQQKYIKNMEVRYSKLLEGTSKVQTPFAPEVLSKMRKGGWTNEEEKEVDGKMYRSLIGSLMYASTCTRPDLAFTVSTLAQASVNPKAIHLNAATRVLRYLKDTSHVVLRYEREKGGELVGYTDADWGSEVDGKSRGAQVFLLGGGAVSWQTKKLTSIATSTTEAEYKALSEGAKEAIWLKRLKALLDGGEERPIVLRCDNQSALALTKNPILHQRTKHFKIAWHFIREAVEEGHVVVEYVSTQLQDADMLTKALAGPKHKNNMERIGLGARRACSPSLALWSLLT